jgi:hypothetical protein
MSWTACHRDPSTYRTRTTTAEPDAECARQFHSHAVDPQLCLTLTRVEQYFVPDVQECNSVLAVAPLGDRMLRLATIPSRCYLVALCIAGAQQYCRFVI